MFPQGSGGSTPPPGTTPPPSPRGAPLSPDPRADEERRPPAPRPQPTALQLFRWSLILIAVSLLVAALAIPLLRWLDLA